MKHDKILVPYDGSEGAKNAVRYAVRILEDAPEAKIIVFTSLAGAKDIEKLMGTGREGTGVALAVAGGVLLASIAGLHRGRSREDRTRMRAPAGTRGR